MSLTERGGGREGERENTFERGWLRERERKRKSGWRREKESV